MERKWSQDSECILYFSQFNLIAKLYWFHFCWFWYEKTKLKFNLDHFQNLYIWGFPPMRRKTSQKKGKTTPFKSSLNLFALSCLHFSYVDFVEKWVLCRFLRKRSWINAQNRRTRDVEKIKKRSAKRHCGVSMDKNKQEISFPQVAPLSDTVVVLETTDQPSFQSSSASRSAKSHRISRKSRLLNLLS